MNRYIDTTAPWVLAKSDPERLKTVMRHIFETLRIVAGLIWPFMPESASKIQEQLALEHRGSDVTLAMLRGWGSEGPVHPIQKAPGLFPRVEADKETPAKGQSQGAAEKKQKPKRR